ncbi:YdcF family protein [Planctomycetaceae bacterium SH139]
MTVEQQTAIQAGVEGPDCVARQTPLGRWSEFRVLLVGVFLAGCLLSTLPVINFFQFGWQNTERVLTNLAVPMGLGWLGLTVLASVAVVRRFAWGKEAARGWWLWPLCWLLLTVAGNTWVARWAVQLTEHPPGDAWRRELPLDAVVLLGGAIGEGLDGGATLNRDGDRLRPVLQLWFAGQVEQIIVTGTSSMPGQLGPAELTGDLLESVGVPADVILRIEGKNTTEEMRGLSEWARQVSGDVSGRELRIGVVTSAFHIPRALRLAEQQGLDLVPIPAAYRQSDQSLGFARSIIPGPGALEDLGLCWKEWLAAALGR